MKYIILFEDNPSADPGIRRRLMPEHLAFLEAHAAEIEAAGPLRDGGGAPAGGIWIVEAEGEAAAERLVKADPFWPTGLRAGYRILAWTMVYAEGRRLIEPA